MTRVEKLILTALLIILRNQRGTRETMPAQLATEEKIAKELLK
jgi:hypothetical protein